MSYRVPTYSEHLILQNTNRQPTYSDIRQFVPIPSNAIHENTKSTSFYQDRNGVKQFPVPSGVAKFKNPSGEVYRLPRYEADRNDSFERSFKPRVDPANAVGAAAGVAGAASIVAPAFLPVAAALGVGYGTYKLGESLNLW